MIEEIDRFPETALEGTEKKSDHSYHQKRKKVQFFYKGCIRAYFIINVIYGSIITTFRL